MSWQPLVIIGAGRSGTNILRDTLTHLPGWETWDCDEINLIWRHGNLSMPHDVFGPDEARPEVAAFIRKQFERFRRKSGASVVIEKTCANSLRVPFIEAVLPEARYLYIVRDGRDVALSAAKRWTASVEPKYLLKKLRYVPLADLPTYMARFARNRVHQKRSSEKRQASWGPIFPGMRQWVEERPLIDVCAQQWASCVEASDRAFDVMGEERVCRVTYETLVTNPVATLCKVTDWWSDGAALPPEALTAINAQSLHGWKKKRDQFTDEALAIMAPTLQRHGYETAT